MWEKQISMEIEVTKAQIWDIWSDVKNWKTWDHEVESSELNGKFEKGTKGFIKPANGPKSTFSITSAKYPNEFTIRSFLPLAKMDFIHKMNEKDNKILLTHGIKISGLTSFLFAKLIGQKIINELPKTMENLVSRAKRK